MEDIFLIIAENKNVFEDFRQWLFIKVNKNKQNFINVGKYPNNFKIPYLLEYLETKEVNIIEALTYYTFEHSYTKYEDICLYMIIKEFKRGEENKKINYEPY